MHFFDFAKPTRVHTHVTIHERSKFLSLETFETLSSKHGVYVRRDADADADADPRCAGGQPTTGDADAGVVDDATDGNGR